VPPDPDDAPHAYLVKVNLSALAENLYVFTDARHDEIEAAIWLTKPRLLSEEWRIPHDKPGQPVEEPSPFRATNVGGVFYSLCDPRSLLEEGEILWVHATRKRPWGRGPITLTGDEARV
jgi:hypothetical protein